MFENVVETSLNFLFNFRYPESKTDEICAESTSGIGASRGSLTDNENININSSNNNILNRGQTTSGYESSSRNLTEDTGSPITQKQHKISDKCAVIDVSSDLSSSERLNSHDEKLVSAVEKLEIVDAQEVWFIDVGVPLEENEENQNDNQKHDDCQNQIAEKSASSSSELDLDEDDEDEENVNENNILFYAV